MSPSAIEMADGPVLDENLNIFNKKGSDMQSMAVGAVKKDGTSAVPTMPVFESKEAEQKYCKEHMACAFRVFAANGFDEGLAGHMSLRDPINPKTFWINPYVFLLLYLYTLIILTYNLSDTQCTSKTSASRTSSK